MEKLFFLLNDYESEYRHDREYLFSETKDQEYKEIKEIKKIIDLPKIEISNELLKKKYKTTQDLKLIEEAEMLQNAKYMAEIRLLRNQEYHIEIQKKWNALINYLKQNPHLLFEVLPDKYVFFEQTILLYSIHKRLYSLINWLSDYVLTNYKSKKIDFFYQVDSHGRNILHYLYEDCDDKYEQFTKVFFLFLLKNDINLLHKESFTGQLPLQI